MPGIMPAPGSTHPAALDVADLRRSFGGVPAVDGASFSVSAGEIVGLIGPNGSGKSTTVNLISGALRCDGGRTLVGGRNVTNRPTHAVARHGLARTFQVPRVWGRMTVAENLLVAGAAYGTETITRAVSRRRSLRAQQLATEREAVTIMQTLDLARLADEPAEVLSGGQKR